MEKKQKIYLGSALIILVVLFGLFFFTDRELQPGGLTQCEETGGELVNGQCDCPKSFPEYNQETGRCQTAWGESPISKEYAQVMKDRYNFVDDCKQQEGETYVVPETGITFCYQSDWGFPKQVIGPTPVGKMIFATSQGQTKSPEIYFSHDLASLQAELQLDLSNLPEVPSGEKSEDGVVYSLKSEGKIIGYYLRDSVEGWQVVLKGAKEEELSFLAARLWFDKFAD
ncbi:MAG TPA: hypothetical protein VJB37_01525 [Patescibacteria group bacterium]|nr:hypothetical protein [Patescibacteria group bacterium]